MKTLSFNPSQIPILGERFRLAGWFPTVLVICQCDAKTPVMIPLGALSACQACGYKFAVAGYAAQTGNIQFQITVMAPDGDEQLVKGNGRAEA